MGQIWTRFRFFRELTRLDCPLLKTEDELARFLEGLVFGVVGVDGITPLAGMGVSSSFSGLNNEKTAFESECGALGASRAAPKKKLFLETSANPVEWSFLTLSFRTFKRSR